MTDNDYKIMEILMKSNQKRTKDIMDAFLSKYYPKENIIKTNDYLIAIGDISVALIAHFDTVMEEERYIAELYWDRKKQVMFCPGFPGFDDKAGIYAIIKIIQKGLRPSVILCCDEEPGNIGAKKLADIPCPIPDLKYMIELDRHGENDMVFYDCYCPSFINYIESYGFLEKSGSYTDICALMDTWHICGVNLSIGFENEHDYSEILYVDAMFATINKVEQMLRDAKNLVIPFEYGTKKNILNDWYHSNSRDCDWDYEDLLTTCSMCGEQMLEFEAMYVEGNKVCENCFEKHLMEEHN